MLKSNPFDPLNYLEKQLRLRVNLAEDGRVLVGGLSSLPGHRKKKAVWVVNNYKELLKMQLNAESPQMRPSVRKLLAQDKLRIENGRYLKIK
jgi:hypothetical protein